MRIRNLAKDTKTIISNGNVFSGTVDGQTYTATADSQLLRLWGNIILPMPSSGGTCTAILKDMQGSIRATTNGVTLENGVAICRTANWYTGLVMDSGAKVTLQCRGYFADSDWQVMQSLGVSCFDKDTAAY